MRKLKKNQKFSFFPLRVNPELLVFSMSRQQNNAFTMHSNACIMLRKNVAAMPMCSGGIRVFADLRPASRVPQSRVFFYLNNLLLINLFINQFNSL